MRTIVTLRGAVRLLIMMMMVVVVFNVSANLFLVSIVLESPVVTAIEAAIIISEANYAINTYTHTSVCSQPRHSHTRVCLLFLQLSLFYCR